MSGRLSGLLSWIAVLSAGLLSFAVVRLAVPVSYASADGRSLQVYSLSEATRLLAEDARKPHFFGEMNGILFKERTTPTDVGCSAGVEAIDPAKAVEEQFAVSPTYVPTGFQLVHETSAACDGKVVSYYQFYSGPLGELEIGRTVGSIVDFTAPADRIKSIDVNGMPAVVILAVPGPNSPRELMSNQQRAWRLYVRNGDTVVEVVSRGVTLDEGIKVAQQIGGLN